MSQHQTDLATAALDVFAAQFDDLFSRPSQRRSLRHYLRGLLQPWPTPKHLAGLAAAQPGATVEQLHHFLVDAPWSVDALNQRRLQLLQTAGYRWHDDGVLVVHAIGERKQGAHTAFVARQYLPGLNIADTGVVSVLCHWADAASAYPLDLRPFTPPGRLAARTMCDSQAQLALELVTAAEDAAIPFKLVVGDRFSGDGPDLAYLLQDARVPYILGEPLQHAAWPSHATAGPPSGTAPLAVARELPAGTWQPVATV